MKDIGMFLAGVLVGVVFAGWMLTDPPPTRDELQLEYAAYRLCMQSASKTRCQMTPRDFVRYYEIKQILERANGNANE